VNQLSLCTIIAQTGKGVFSSRDPSGTTIKRQGESVAQGSNFSRRLCVAILFVSVLLLGVAAAGCGGGSTTITALQLSSTTTGSTQAQTTLTTAATTQGPSTTAGQSSLGGSAESSKLTYGANAVEYAVPVTADQAQKLLDYLASTFSWDKTSPSGMSFAIEKTGNVYQLAMVIQKGKETDPTILSSAKTLAQDSSQKVFGGAEVDVYLTDATWNPLAVVKP